MASVAMDLDFPLHPHTPRTVMRLLFLAAFLAPAAPLVAQEPASHALVSFEIDTEPPENDSPDGGIWVEAGQVPGGIAVREFRIRVNGVEGGWSFPVLGLDIGSGYQTAPAWMTQFAGTQEAASLQWYGCQFTVENPPGAWRAPLFQRYVNAVLASGQTVSDAKYWCQPFLTQQPNSGVLNPSTRLWTADGPLWNGPIGGLNKSLWMGILEDLAAGSPNPRLTAFSGGAAVRQALLMQSIIATGTTDQAINYLNSSDFKVAVSEGWLFLVLQVFALRSAGLPIGTPIGAPWDTDDKVPGLGAFNPPPKIGITGYEKVGVSWPEHSGGGVSPLGNLVPNQVFTFTSNWATPPVTLWFPKANGVTSTVARAAGTLDSPGRMRAQVPADAVAGPILYQAGLDPFAVIIGHIPPQVGQ